MTLNDLASRMEAAAAAYDRVMEMGDSAEADVLAIAGALALSFHGHLFAEAARVLRSRIDGGGNG